MLVHAIFSVCEELCYWRLCLFYKLEVSYESLVENKMFRLERQLWNVSFVSFEDANKEFWPSGLL